MSTRIIVKSPDELEGIANQLLESYPQSRVFAFYGNMGAGKTTFIKSICEVLKVKDNVTSPTFAIINEYRTRADYTVYHFDFYRINKPAEALSIGADEYFYSGEYCLIEWPELVEEILPEETIKVKIEVDHENSWRHFSF